MKETGLMFKAPLVRAILSGQKTQTRRVLRNQRAYDLDKCPFGQPGDRIYVRETWQGPLMSPQEWEAHYFSNEEELPAKFKTPAYCKYAADGGAAPEFMNMDDELVARWKPSIHMPKWAARLWLEVTGVRVERLHDISETDASREGLAYSTEQMGHWCGNGRDWQMTARQAFRDLWIETGGDWAANPWVWVINFKRIEMPQGSAA